MFCRIITQPLLAVGAIHCLNPDDRIVGVFLTCHSLAFVRHPH